MFNARNCGRALLAVAVAAVPMIAGSGAAYAAAPGNDDVVNAKPISSIPFTDHVDTTEATASGDDQCGSATVWYSFTPTQDTAVEFNTDGSDFDTRLGLYTGDPSALTLVECNDDSGFGIASQIVADVQAGVTYYVSAGYWYTGYGPGPGPGGALVVNAQPVPAPLDTVAVTVKGGTVTRLGVVTLTGTVTCNSEATAEIAVTLAQRFVRSLAQGSGYVSAPCGPAPTTWQAQFRSETGTIFGAGSATANSTAYGYNVRGSHIAASPEQSIRLATKK